MHPATLHDHRGDVAAEKLPHGDHKHAEFGEKQTQSTFREILGALMVKSDCRSSFDDVPGVRELDINQPIWLSFCDTSTSRCSKPEIPSRVCRKSTASYVFSEGRQGPLSTYRRP